MFWYCWRIFEIKNFEKPSLGRGPGGVLGRAPGVTRPVGTQFRQKFHLFFGSLFWTKNQPFLNQKWTIFGFQKRGFSKENVDEKHGFSKHAKSQK